MVLFAELAAGKREYYQIEKRYIRKDGRIVWGRLTESLARDNEGNPSFAIAMVEDITDRVQAEEQLREREAQYRSIVEATSDGLIILDLQGRIVDANAVACAMYGYTREEFIGLDSRALTHPDDREHVEVSLQAIGQGGEYHSQGIAVRQDGSTFHAEGRGSTFLYRGERHILAVVRDVTEQVKAYELLEQRVEERTRELFTLLDVSRNVASMLELEPLLHLILDQLKVVALYSGAALFLVQEENLVILVRRAPGPDPEAGPKRYSLAEAGPLWKLLQQGEMAIIDDVRGETPLARAYYRAALEGYLDFHRSPFVYLDDPALSAPLEHVPRLYQVWGTLEIVDAVLRAAGNLGYRVVAHSLMRRQPHELYLQILPNGASSLRLVHPSTGAQVDVIPERTYGSGPGLHSISFGQRPDVAVEIRSPGQPTRIYVFDPKYKLDSESIEGMTSSRPVKMDLDKMHAYRDAIRDRNGERPVCYAAILYPGDSERYPDAPAPPEVEALHADPGNREPLEDRLQEVIKVALQSPES